MRLTGNWGPKVFLGPLIGSYLRSVDETLLSFLTPSTVKWRGVLIGISIRTSAFAARSLDQCDLGPVASLGLRPSYARVCRVEPRKLDTPVLWVVRA